MTLGRFGGRGPMPRGTSAFTGAAASESEVDDLLSSSRAQLIPSPEGMPALSPQLAQALATYGVNLLVNGSAESWSAGTSSAPDGWTLTGAGAAVARNTTSGQIQDGQASCNVTAALNTATDLAQSIAISATQNTRLRGREVTFSARVRATVADRVFLRVDDGVLTKDSRFHVGDSAFETLAVTITVDSAATKIEASLEISSGASITATMDAAKLEDGAQATSWAPNARDVFVQPRSVTVLNSSTTTTSTTAVVMASMSIANVIVDGTQSVYVYWHGNLSHSNAGETIAVQLYRNTTEIPQCIT